MVDWHREEAIEVLSLLNSDAEAGLGWSRIVGVGLFGYLAVEVENWLRRRRDAVQPAKP